MIFEYLKTLESFSSKMVLLYSKLLKIHKLYIKTYRMSSNSENIMVIIFLSKKKSWGELWTYPFKEQFQSIAKSPEVYFPSSQKVHSTSLGAIFDSWSIGDIYFSLRQLLRCQIKHFMPKSGSENLVSSPKIACSCWGV